MKIHTVIAGVCIGFLIVAAIRRPFINSHPCPVMEVKFYDHGKHVETIVYDSVVLVSKVGGEWKNKKTGNVFIADSLSIKLK